MAAVVQLAHKNRLKLFSLSPFTCVSSDGQLMCGSYLLPMAFRHFYCDAQWASSKFRLIRRSQVLSIYVKKKKTEESSSEQEF
jgi:hypothetical protein